MRKAVLGSVAAAALVAGCGQSRAENGGPTVERSYQVGAFERIEVAGPFEVHVRTGGAPSVSASGPEKLMERLVVEVKGDRLEIHPRKDRGFFNWGSGRNSGTVVVEVTAPSLREATIAGSGGIAVDKVSGSEFKGSVAGSGDLDLQSVAVERLKLAIAGSGDIRAAGTARNVDYAIAGSGDIDAGAIRSETAAISIAGSGNIAGQASGTADVDIMGSGDVALTGGAKCTVSKAGSGNVDCS